MSTVGHANVAGPGVYGSIFDSSGGGLQVASKIVLPEDAFLNTYNLRAKNLSGSVEQLWWPCVFVGATLAGATKIWQPASIQHMAASTPDGVISLPMGDFAQPGATLWGGYVMSVGGGFSPSWVAAAAGSNGYKSSVSGGGLLGPEDPFPTPSATQALVIDCWLDYTPDLPIPVNTVAPIITGTAAVGESLTGDDGTWDDADTVTGIYQRSANGVSSWADIGGTTSTTYALQSADRLKYIRRLSTATNDSGPATHASNVVGPIGTMVGSIFIPLAFQAVVATEIPEVGGNLLFLRRRRLIRGGNLV